MQKFSNWLRSFDTLPSFDMLVLINTNLHCVHMLYISTRVSSTRLMFMGLGLTPLGLQIFSRWIAVSRETECARSRQVFVEFTDMTSQTHQKFTMFRQRKSWSLFFRFLLGFDWEDISKTQDSVWPHFQTFWSFSKILRCTPSFLIVFSTLFSVFGNVVKHGLSCLIYYLKVERVRKKTILLLEAFGS